MAIDRDKLKAYQAAPPRVDLSTLTASPPETASPTPAPEAVIADSAPALAPAAPADPVEPVAPVAAIPDGERPDPSPDHRSRSQERIEDLAAQLKATREYAEYQARIIAQHAQGKAPEATPVADTDLPPTLEAHGFDQAKWAQAHAQWTQRQVDARVQHALQKSQSEIAATASRNAFQTRIDAFKATAADFDVVTANPALPPLSKTAARLIVDSEKGPQLVYHLAKNPAVAAHIARMSPDSQAMALGRLEVQLSAPAPKAATTTRAPPPPTQTPSGSSNGTTDPSKMSMKEFVERERQAAAARRARRAGMQ